MDVSRTARAATETLAQSALVVDDHPLFCEALSLALKGGLGLKRVVTAHTLGAALEMIAGGLEVDAVALDLNLPDVSGVDGLMRLKAATPRTPVVVVSAMSDARIVAQVMRAGAAGFVPKNVPSAELVSAMRHVLDGELYVPPGMVLPREGGAAEPDPAGAAERLGDLTPQQLRILGLVCEGKLNKQIAFDLDIAETTVKAHITAILRKLGVQSRTQAVLVARKVSFSDILRD